MNKALGVLLFAMCALGMRAQSGPLQIGTVTNVGTGNCPANLGWITGPGTVVCKHATVNCPMENGTSIASLGVTFAYYQNPLTPIRGTIVFFSDGDGTSPTGSEDPDLASHTIAQYISDYYNVRYQLVQTAWDSPE